jgi:hypothetical protein
MASTPQHQHQQQGTVVVGDLLPDEMSLLAKLREQSDQIIHQIGLNRVAEQRLMQQLQQAERSAQITLNKAGARLGIPDGTPWQVTGEGQAVVITSNLPRPVVAPAAEPPQSGN